MLEQVMFDAAAKSYHTCLYVHLSPDDMGYLTSRERKQGVAINDEFLVWIGPYGKIRQHHLCLSSRDRLEWTFLQS